MINEQITYEAALEQFGELLGQLSCSRKMVWAFAEDLAWVDGILHVRSPLPKENAGIVRAAFASHSARTLGIELRALARLEDMTVCSILVPHNDQQSNELLISGFKLSVPDHMPPAQLVPSGLKWYFLRKKHIEPSPVWDVPARLQVHVQ